jgi:hypothetical protein
MLDYLKPRGNTDGTKVYRLTGQTPITNIDFPRTLWERSTQWWENEIVLLDDSQVKILAIEEFKL